jgi:hypothetical protein
MPIPYLKNKGPLLVDRVRGYFDRLPPWLREMVTIRVEKQKVDAKISDLDSAALTSELKQEVTDEKLRTSRYLGDGADGSGNDMSMLPASNLSEVVLTQTGQVADVTETVSATETHLVEGPPLQDGQSEQVGDLWVTKKVEAPTFDRKSFQVQKDDLMPPEFRASIPEVTTQHQVDGVAVMPTLGAIDLVKKEEQTKVGVKMTTSQTRDTSGPTPTLSGFKWDPEYNGASTFQAKSIVPPNTSVGQTFGNVKATVAAYDAQHSVKEIWSTPSFPTISLHNFDATLGVQTVQEINIVQQGGGYTPPASKTMLDYQSRKLDAVHTMRLEEYVPNLPGTRVENSSQNVTFPSILTYISFVPVHLAEVNRSEPQWVAGVRSGFSTWTPTFTHISFWVNKPATTALFVWKPTDVIFKGVSYSISLSNVLTDAWTNIGVTYAGDTKYGSLSDRFNINATVPSASTYTNTIGQQVCIASVVKKYKMLWTREDTYIELK